MIGFHIQRMVDGWNKAVLQQTPNTVNKSFRVQHLTQIKTTNPNTVTVLRHWYDPEQKFEGDYDRRARTFFSTFVDDTFRHHAKSVDFIEGWNEYLKNGQTQEEVAERVAWVNALTNVWKNEYRVRPEYSHIRLIVANAAVGNDIPFEIARIAYYGDAVLGYHPYMPFKRGRPFEYLNGINKSEISLMDDGRRYYWLRWQIMDDRYRRNNIYPKWIFTEMGPLNYTEYPGGIHLDWGGGWRHPDVCDGDVKMYVECVRLYMDAISKWNEENNNRVLGGALFTTNRNSTPAWRSFETAQPEMSMIAEALYNYTPPKVQPPMMPNLIYKELWEKSIKLQTMRLNPEAKLQKTIVEDNFVPVQSEWTNKFGDIVFRCQAAENLKTGERRLYFAVVDDWDNIKWFTK